MKMIAAYIFTGSTAVVISFYLALIFGMPWGAAAMGGKYPGKFPIHMRVISMMNILVMVALNVVVLSRANLMFHYFYKFSKSAIWGVVLFYLIGSILNTITPSKIERIWAPVAVSLLLTSYMIAI